MAFKANVAGINELLHSPVGPVGLHVVEVAHAILAVAEVEAPESAEHDPSKGPRLKDTGSVIPNGHGGASVVFSASYAGFVVTGTSPHIISATNARALRFAWPKMGGGVYFFRSVMSPGTQPNNFLMRAVATVAAAPLV